MTWPVNLIKYLINNMIFKIVAQKTEKENTANFYDESIILTSKLDKNIRNRKLETYLTPEHRFKNPKYLQIKSRNILKR